MNADVAFQVPWGVEGGLAAVGADGCEVGEWMVGGDPSQCGCWCPVCLGRG